MKISKDSKFFIINSRKEIQDFYSTETEAIEEKTKLNKFYNNRPHTEFGYAMGHHDFEVVEIEPSTDFSIYQFNCPVRFAGVLVGGEYVRQMNEAVTKYFSTDGESTFEILVKYIECYDY